MRGTFPKGEPVGEWDLEIQLADRFGWTPDQIAGMEIAYIEELSEYLQAEEEQRKHEKMVSERTNRRSGRR